MTPQERIRRHLAFLYGEDAAQTTWEQVSALLEAFRQSAAGRAYRREASPSSCSLSERDAILITYGDTFRQAGEPPLKTLGTFLTRQLGDAVSSVHILPFYPYSSDDGFSVIDYRAVDPALGSWADIAALTGTPPGSRYKLMFDAVINHVSRQSDWFQRYRRGEAPYQAYFITAEDGWDLSRVVRPRTLPLLTGVETASGPRRVWTTFSADQIDLNYANPQVLMEIISLLLFYVEQGAALIRLDAIAYLWKQAGTACIHLPQTHTVIKVLRDVLDLAAPHVLLISETNVPHDENIRYFGELNPETGCTDEAQLVYQFPLAPLVLHTFRTGDAGALSAWLDGLDQPGTYLNFIASHDGIGLTPAAGLLSPGEIAHLAGETLAHGGQVSYRTNPDGSLSPYELNITLYDALNDPARPDPALDTQRFLASQAIMLSLAGVPGIYVHSLFGSRNCLSCAEETGRARSINREKLDYPALVRRLGGPDGGDGPLVDPSEELHGRDPEARRQAGIFAAYRRLLRIRSNQPAFHPSGPQQVLPAGGKGVLALQRTSPDGEQSMVCLVNVTPQPQSAAIQPDSIRPGGLDTNARDWKDILTGKTYRPAAGILEAALRPYQFCWLKAASA